MQPDVRIFDDLPALSRAPASLFIDSCSRAIRLRGRALVVSFAGAWLTAESERLALWHLTFGFTLLGLIAFRLVWGVTGTRYALFRNFVTGPSAVVRYLRSLLSPRPEHHVGHNPAGAVAIVLLLLLGVATVIQYGLNSILVSIVLCLVEDRPLKDLWRHCHYWSFPYYLVGTVAAGLMVSVKNSAGAMPSLFGAYWCPWFGSCFSILMGRSFTPEGRGSKRLPRSLRPSLARWTGLSG